LTSLTKIKKNKFNIIVFNTIKGKNLHNEDQLECHYLPLNKKQYIEAVKRITEK